MKTGFIPDVSKVFRFFFLYHSLRHFIIQFPRGCQETCFVFIIKLLIHLHDDSDFKCWPISSDCGFQLLLIQTARLEKKQVFSVHF